MANIFLWGGLTAILAMPTLVPALPWELVGAILMLVGLVLLILGR
jgi:hypothetical protein